MPKHTPTPFYSVTKKNGMKLRSGTTINYSKTAPFWQDYSDWLAVIALCSDAEKRYHNTPEASSCWIHNYKRVPKWIKALKFIKKTLGKYYGTRCTLHLITNKFLKKWRKTVNEDVPIQVKTNITDKLTEYCDELYARNGWEGWPSHCGCFNIRQQIHEEDTWEHYKVFGPGYLDRTLPHGQVWTFTPSVDPEEFEAQWYERRKVWAHMLPELEDQLWGHLNYLNRIPHKSYQEAFFALTSSKINMDCAHNILSYLL